MGYSIKLKSLNYAYLKNKEIVNQLAMVEILLLTYCVIYSITIVLYSQVTVAVYQMRNSVNLRLGVSCGFVVSFFM